MALALSRMILKTESLSFIMSQNIISDSGKEASKIIVSYKLKNGFVNPSRQPLHNYRGHVKAAVLLFFWRGYWISTKTLQIIVLYSVLIG